MRNILKFVLKCITKYFWLDMRYIFGCYSYVLTATLWLCSPAFLKKKTLSVPKRRYVTFAITIWGLTIQSFCISIHLASLTFYTYLLFIMMMYHISSFKFAYILIKATRHWYKWIHKSVWRQLFIKDAFFYIT